MRNALKTLIVSLGTFFVLQEIDLNYSISSGWSLIIALILFSIGAMSEIFAPFLCIGAAGFALFLSNGIEQIQYIKIEWDFWSYFVLICLSFLVTSIITCIASNRGALNINSLIFWGIGIVVITTSLLLPGWTEYQVPWILGDIPRGISFIIIFFCQILFTRQKTDEE